MPQSVSIHFDSCSKDDAYTNNCSVIKNFLFSLPSIMILSYDVSRRKEIDRKLFQNGVCLAKTCIIQNETNKIDKT